MIFPPPPPETGMAHGMEVTPAYNMPAMPLQQTHFFAPNFSVKQGLAFIAPPPAASSTKTAANG